MGTSNRGYGTVRNIENCEILRENLQNKLDSSKSIEDRRKYGQFSTPIELAREIIEYGLNLVEKKQVVFLEPSVGTGAFITAFLEKIRNKEINIDQIIGIEKDIDFYNAAVDIWKSSFVKLQNADFILEEPNILADLVITNPPYVRHHYLDKEYKKKIRDNTVKYTGQHLSGLAGLYCYFIMNVQRWMKPNAICGLLIPSEFMDVKYGEAVKDYILNQVHILKIHRYDPKESKFDDAVVSSCVVWFKNEVVKKDYDIEISYMGTLANPQFKKMIKKSCLEKEKKWTQVFHNKIIVSDGKQEKLGDFFDIKRGVATGDNKFFIMTKEKIQELGLDISLFKPILPSPRHLKVNEVDRDQNGYPDLKIQFFLLDCHLDEMEIQRKFPNLWMYLESGVDSTAEKYLCRNRKKWYFQEQRETTPFLCSYMGRGENGMPFRFILNHSEAIATNSYLMLYPNQKLREILNENAEYITKIWKALQLIDAQDMEYEGRIYGGGLKKIEPKELGNVRFKLDL